MPAKNGETRLIKRLQILLQALTGDYQPGEDLIIAVGLYPDNALSAARMLRGDLDALRLLGFSVERATDTKGPYYRITRHDRYGAEVRVKFCSRCGQWRSLDWFGSNRQKASGKSVYCRTCQRSQINESAAKPESRERHIARALEYQQARPEQRRAYQRAYYSRKRAAGYRKQNGKWIAPDEPTD